MSDPLLDAMREKIREALRLDVTWWRVTTHWSIRHFKAPDPMVTTIPEEVYASLFWARLFNLNALVEVRRNGRWVNVFNWPARRMDPPKKANRELSQPPSVDNTNPQHES